MGRWLSNDSKRSWTVSFLTHDVFTWPFSSRVSPTEASLDCYHEMPPGRFWWLPNKPEIPGFPMHFRPTLFLRGSMIVLTVTTAKQESVQGFLESPHPASLTCLSIKFCVFDISQSAWVQTIFKEERNMKRQSLYTGKARSFIWQNTRRPLLISVIVSL